MPSKPFFPNFPLLGFMGLVHESITYIFSNKINYLVEDFMSLEVLVMVSLSCDQNLEKKGIYYQLAFRCQSSLWYCSCQNWQWQKGWWDWWLAPNLVWELGFFLGWSLVEGRLKGVLQLGQFAYMGCFEWDFSLGLAMRAEYFGGPLTWWFSPLSLSFFFLIVNPTKWTNLPHIAMDFYSTWALVVSKNEMYSWALINIYDRF